MAWKQHKGMTAPWQDGDPSRFAFMTEVSPWTPQEDMMQATLYRGAVLSSWGYIDTALSEISFRCSKLAAYSEIRNRYPYKYSSRIAYLETVLNSPGPLSPYRSFGSNFLSRFKKSAPLRHTMAHASMRVLPQWGAVFTEFTSGKDDSVVRRTQRYQITELEALARKASRLSRICQRIEHVLTTEKLLPAVTET